MTDEFIDGMKITRFVIVGIILIGLIVLMSQQWYKHASIDQKKVCTYNPRERFAQDCNNKEDCIEKCTNRLYDTS